ncbi:MAG: hypothetical protein QE279_01295 [Rhodoferax sp.]|nr:hypothetical protein [Rhodoferax sp.]
MEKMKQIITNSIPACILGISLIIASFISSNNNKYEFQEINGFRVLNNKNTGHSCTLREGDLHIQYRRDFLVPFQLCDEIQASKKTTFSFEEAQLTKPEPAPAKSGRFSFEEAQFTTPSAAESAASPAP